MGILPARSPDDGVARVLTSQPRQGLERGELSLISVTEAGGVSELPLLEKWTCHPVRGCADVDHRGRLFVWSPDPEQAPGVVSSLLLTRIDLDSGDRLEFGKVQELAFSPSRRRAAVSLAATSESSGVVVVLEADDESPTQLWPVRYPAFVGENLYFVDEGQVLWRLPAERPREIVREGVTSLSVIPTNAGPRLFLRLTQTDPLKQGPGVILDPAMGNEWPLPPRPGWMPSLSPDGRWALFHESDAAARRKFSLFELDTGIEEPFEVPVDVIPPQWRPNHVELWFRAASGPGGSTFVKQPQQPLREVPGAIQVSQGSGGSVLDRSFFTSDGSHAFFAEPTDDDRGPQHFVGDADDPTGPRFPMNLPGTRFNQFRELSDGRLVVEAFYRGADRNDIYLVDPRDGATRLLGRDGVTVALGAGRVVTLTHRVDDLGDLEGVDPNDGHAVTLAREFAIFGEVQPRLGDPDVARPGAPIAYQFRARFASPYDGLWLATLP